MTKAEKKKQLEKLDEQVLSLMVKYTGETGDTDKLAELSVAVNYLKSNSIVEEKTKSTIEEDTKERLKKASERRKKNQSE